mmetsp:Transcript_10226/g.18678  ORF Transcript_10226/g.18678 Transcript_10226/m.18678 type:complete len:118 (-) Transcript_10226:870-1223(-)
MSLIFILGKLISTSKLDCYQQQPDASLRANHISQLAARCIDIHIQEKKRRTIVPSPTHHEVVSRFLRSNGVTRSVCLRLRTIINNTNNTTIVIIIHLSNPTQKQYQHQQSAKCTTTN